MCGASSVLLNKNMSTIMLRGFQRSVSSCAINKLRAIAIWYYIIFRNAAIVRRIFPDRATFENKINRWFVALVSHTIHFIYYSLGTFFGWRQKLVFGKSDLFQERFFFVIIIMSWALSVAEGQVLICLNYKIAHTQKIYIYM